MASSWTGYTSFPLGFRLGHKTWSVAAGRNNSVSVSSPVLKKPPQQSWSGCTPAAERWKSSPRDLLPFHPRPRLNECRAWLSQLPHRSTKPNNGCFKLLTIWQYDKYISGFLRKILRKGHKYFCLYLIGQNLAAWPIITAGEAGKCV